MSAKARNDPITGLFRLHELPDEGSIEGTGTGVGNHRGSVARPGRRIGCRALHFYALSEARGFYGGERISVTDSYEIYQEAFKRSSLRDATFTTMSGIPLEPVYGPRDGEFPGVYPYTRGPHASMYRSKLWTMRMFAGFGIATDTNQRFKEIIRSGGDGLSTAFDMPTLLGLDSDDEMALGEVGRCGVAIDTLQDMSDLYDGIDLSSITTSMTINSPAAVIFAMFIAQAEKAGVERAKLGGTLQNDILKEYQAQKEFVFPPRQSMRLVRDTMVFTATEMPKWNSISISGYHIREAGSTAAEELAFTLANGFAYVELAKEAGLSIDEVAPRLSFFFNAHIDFFEEIAKYRAARRLWAAWTKDHYGAQEPKSHQLRFHTQTAGVSLTAQQPEVNIVRTAIEALAGVLGGTQSLHTNSMDEALALPTEKAARIALRTQQVLAYETNVANVADPLGGSYFVESLTTEMVRQAEQIFSEISAMGDGSMLEGCIRGIEENYFQGRIADSAYELERRFNAGQRYVVGVNRFLEGNDDEDLATLKITGEDEQKQRQRLSKVRQDRDDEAVHRSLEALAREAQDPEVNLMPALIEAAKNYVSVGEMMSTMAGVFGRYVERVSI